MEYVTSVQFRKQAEVLYHMQASLNGLIARYNQSMYNEMS